MLRSTGDGEAHLSVDGYSTSVAFSSRNNSERIIAKIHDNNVNASNTLELSSPIVELDVSDITVTSSGTTHTTTYKHPLDLSRNKISAQIEPDTILTFTADESDKNNFTVQYTTDEHNDNVVQLGLDNVSYDTH